jgi:hypothetical protein
MTPTKIKDSSSAPPIVSWTSDNEIGSASALAQVALPRRCVDAGMASGQRRPENIRLESRDGRLGGHWIDFTFHRAL